MSHVNVLEKKFFNSSALTCLANEKHDEQAKVKYENKARNFPKMNTTPAQSPFHINKL